MKIWIAAVLISVLACGQSKAVQLNEIAGTAAYTDVILFDYSKDGNVNRVQFWLEFKGSPALGDPDDTGYTPESGSIYYYLVDVDSSTQVDNWLMGFSMMTEPPPRGPYPMTNIRIKDRTATFSAFGMNWTVMDGGEGYGNDEVTIDDGFRPRKMRLYGGDLSVTTKRQGEYEKPFSISLYHWNSLGRWPHPTRTHYTFSCSWPLSCT